MVQNEDGLEAKDGKVTIRDLDRCHGKGVLQTGGGDRRAVGTVSSASDFAVKNDGSTKRGKKVNLICLFKKKTHKDSF